MRNLFLRFRSLWRRQGAAIMLPVWLGFAGAWAQGQVPPAAVANQGVLVLLSTGYGQAGIDNYAKGLYGVLREQGISFTNIHIEYLDMVKNPGPDYRQQLAELLRSKYQTTPIGAIVTLQPAALNFLLQEARQIAPAAAVLVAQAKLPAGADKGRHDFHFQTPTLDFAGTLQRALEFFPKTQRVVFLNGNSAIEQERQADAKRQFAPWQDQLAFEYLDGVAFEDIERQLTNAPPHTVIIAPGVNRDGKGKVYVPVETIVRIAKTANAPVFPVYSVSIGQGPMGGMVSILEDEGKSMGLSVVDLLRRPPEERQSFKVQTAKSVAMFDWRQIERWGGDWSKLPADTVYLHRPPSLWGQYKGYVVSGGLVIVILSGLVIALALQNRRRLRAELSLMSSQARYQHLALFDDLTQLPNRKLLQDRMRQAMVSSGRTQRIGALLFIDLDHFKNLNDTKGHDVGDRLLQQAALRLQRCVRSGDTVARLGGDEFVILLEDLDENLDRAASEARIIGEKVLAAFIPDFDLDGIEYHITTSLGITLFKDHAETSDELLKRADLAMYQAKSAGRDALRFFDPQMQAMVTARAALEADLRKATQVGQFMLHYQPQVHADGHLIGAEALVRWVHPERGMVSPAEFIPLAEESGLILPMGHWVLEAACRQLVAWAAMPATAGLTLAVNMSSRQFRHPGFVDEVVNMLQLTGAPAQRLKLELTESLLLDDVEETIAKMLQLKQLGVSFSLDDFGTGYSSLAYLKRLPLDQLKIDQSFVRDVLTDPNDAAIAHTVVALGQSLALQVIAEGVETEAQRQFLEQHGCQAYQGYLFSKPLPVDAFNQFVANRS